MTTMPPNVRASLRLIGQGLSLAFWRRPRSPVVLTGFGTYVLCVLLSMLLFALQDYVDVDRPATFYGDGFNLHASYFLIGLFAAWTTVLAMNRPALWLTFAALAVIFALPWMALAIQLPLWLDTAGILQLRAWKLLLALAGVLVLWRTLIFLAPECSALRRLAAAMLFVAIMAWPWYARQEAWLWYPQDHDDAAPELPSPSPSPTDEQPENAPDNSATATPGIDPKLVMAEQPALLRQSLLAVAPQIPGKVELFTVGFAGDGSESLFRNEVEYFSRLMAQRFGAQGHTLSLINNPGTVDQIPLASLGNLRTALNGIATRMDPHEDVLLLFLTSHGSRDHRLYVDLDPIAFEQITPQNLRQSLDASGIRNRIVVVSACYSGGFVDALRDAHTLVITAARADRSSFGCGVDSDITWFGKAFLSIALNQTTDFEQAFALAGKQVHEWELAEDDTPSLPQISVGAAIHEKLQVLRTGFPDAPALPFVVAGNDRGKDYRK